MASKGSREAARRAEAIRRATRLSPCSCSKIAELSLERKRFEFQRLREAAGLSVEEAAEACEALEDAGLIEPLKSAASVRASQARAYSKYSFAIERRDEASIAASRRLDMAVTRGNPGLFERKPWLFADNRAQLEALSDWLIRSYGMGEVEPVSFGERAYEIWGDEKILLDGQPHGASLRSVLARLKFDKSALRAYSTAEGMFRSYALPSPGYCVVSENLDFYFSLKRELRSGPVRLLGREISGVVFGSGQQALSDAFDRYLSQERLRDDDLLYVGDIDVSGIQMAQGFQAAHGDAIFWEMYEHMTLLHAFRRLDGLTLNRYPEKQKQSIDLPAFCSRLSSNAADEVRRCIEESVRIPQEIIDAAELKELIFDGMGRQ